MLLNRILIFSLMVAILVGCGTKKHISRDRVLYHPPTKSAETGITFEYSPGNSFTGRLNLLYEKKIRGSADSPIYAGNGIVSFRTTRQRYLAFDQISGDKILRIKKRGGYVLNPAITDSLLILIKRSAYGEVQVRNLFTGKVMEERTLKDIRSGPIIVQKGLIFGTTDGLLSLSIPDLEIRWRSGAKTMVNITAVSDSQNIYYAAGNGTLKAVRADNGAELWERDCGSAIVSELSLGRFIYVGTADSVMMAIDSKNGMVIWQHSSEYQVHGGIAEFDGHIFFGGTDGKVFCLSSEEGEPRWQYQTEGIVTASPIIYGPAVLVGSHDRHFYSLDRNTGKLIDRRRLEGPVVLAAVADNDRIFVACRRNRLYCYEGNHEKSD